MSGVLLVVNPFASGVTESRLAAVEGALRAHFEVKTERTRGAGPATELAAGASGVDAVVVFGGDGAYNEVLNGLRGRGPVGFVPGGGTSVLPRALGLPRDAAAAARRIADALVAGRTRTISLGRVNGRRFAFNAGIGIDAEAVRRVDELGRRTDGKRPGDLAFAAAIARVLADRRLRWKQQLEIEGHGRAGILFVANGDPYSYAGLMPLRVVPGARFEGGLDFVALTDVRPRTLPRLVGHAARGRLDRSPGVLRGHDLDRFEVRCDQPLPLQVDGEDLGDVERAAFEAERDAVAVLV